MVGSSMRWIKLCSCISLVTFCEFDKLHWDKTVSVDVDRDRQIWIPEIGESQTSCLSYSFVSSRTMKLNLHTDTRPCETTQTASIASLWRRRRLTHWSIRLLLSETTTLDRQTDRRDCEQTGSVDCSLHITPCTLWAPVQDGQTTGALPLPAELNLLVKLPYEFVIMSESVMAPHCIIYNYFLKSFRRCSTPRSPLRRKMPILRDRFYPKFFIVLSLKKAGSATPHYQSSGNYLYPHKRVLKLPPSFQDTPSRLDLQYGGVQALQVQPCYCQSKCTRLAASK